MINAAMREYNYYLYTEDEQYGQDVLERDNEGNPIVQGTVTLAIHNTSKSIQDNLQYEGATYLGLTHDKNISSKYVIQYGEDRLKVLYVTPAGRYRQVFMNSL